MRSRFVTIISIFLHLLLPSVTAQLISVKSHFERDSIMIGDQVSFIIHLEAAPNVEFLFPNVKDTLSRNIEVLFPISSDTSFTDSKRVVDQTFMITSFEPGLQMVPAQHVVYHVGEFSDTVLSMPIFLQVYEPVVDTTQQIKPIKPPMNTPLTFKEVLPWIVVGFSGLLLAVFIVFLTKKYRQRHKNPTLFSQKPLEPAHVIAFRELDRLKEDKVWEKGRIRPYYTRLTEIVRRYIERQFGIPAMESTTQEILYSFHKSNAEDTLLDEMLKELLELADLVKFAKEDPLPVENQSNLNNAYLFVQKTYPLFHKEDPEQNEGDE